MFLLLTGLQMKRFRKFTVFHDIQSYSPGTKLHVFLVGSWLKSVSKTYLNDSDLIHWTSNKWELPGNLDVKLALSEYQ